MSIKIERRAPEEVAADLLVVPCFIPDTGPGSGLEALSSFDEASGGLLSTAIGQRLFSAEVGKAANHYGLGRVAAARVLLVGLGARDELTEETLRRAGAAAAHARASAKTVAIVTNHLPRGRDGQAEALVSGFQMAAYRFDEHKSDTNQGRPAPRLALVGEASDLADLSYGARLGESLAAGVGTARDLGNQPGNHMTPRLLAEHARRMARRVGLKATVLDEARMNELGMGAILAVSRGSVEPARMIVLEHGREHAGRGDTVCLVGKGLTFDSGGISIKPPAEMDKMRYDMCGGAVVVGTMQAVAELDLPQHVVGIVPSSENLPDAAAMKPGDVISAMDGTTIEVLNTDAEGRLILADALCYAQRYRPSLVIDLATLTGAVIIALGKHMAGAMGSSEEALEHLHRAGLATHERVWRLPLDEDFDRQIRGQWADLKNIGGREAGTVTAGQFLQHFAGDTPWVHLDIAGVSWDDKVRPYHRGTGATGFGVRLLSRFLEERSQAT